MTDILHVGDIGTEIYIDVTEDGVSLDGDLSGFTTRTVRIRRGSTDDIVVITGATIAVDPEDSVSKLKLVTGSNASLTLTGTGGFVIPSDSLGTWIAEVLLADAGWTGTTAAFELFDARPKIG